MRQLGTVASTVLAPKSTFHKYVPEYHTARIFRGRASTGYMWVNLNLNNIVEFPFLIKPFVYTDSGPVILFSPTVIS